MSNLNNQEELAAYRQKLAESAKAALSSSSDAKTKTENVNTSTNANSQQQEDRQWRNLSNPKEYEAWSAERRDKPEDWQRYKDERLSGALSGGSGLSKEEQENQRREYWKAKDTLRGI